MPQGCLRLTSQPRGFQSLGEAVAEAVEIVRDAVGELLEEAHGRPEFVVGKLLEIAGRTEDSSRTYALLSEAERVARQGNHTDLVTAICVRRCGTFDIDTHQSLLDSLDRLDVNVSEGQRIFDFYVAVARDTMTAERFAVARRALVQAAKTTRAVETFEKDEARSLRRKSRGLARMPLATWPAMEKEAGEVLAELEEWRAAFERYESGEQLLATNEDGSARRKVGLYLCVYREAWPDGLAHLAKCDCPGLRNVCHRDLAMNEDVSLAEILAVADIWWKLRSDPEMPKLERHVAAIRAGMLYRKVSPRLNDPVDQSLVERRLAEGP